MGCALADIANLEREITGKLPLNGEVPLIGHSWLNVPPGQHRRVDEGITGRRCCRCKRAFNVKRGGACFGIRASRLGWSEGRILRRAQVGSGALLELRDREATAYHGFASPHRRTPSKSESRFEIQPTIGGWIQS